MYCRKCGTQNDDNAYKCVRCSELLQAVALKQIDNNLVLAIFVTILCCLPLGVVGIVHAAQVNAKAQAGDIAGAEESARKARTWSLWALGIGLAGFTVYALIAIGATIAETR
ncbi:MAG: CD225/dispanin family protein [Acidobacteriota bacterium]|nr:CD225/dispanin family protein [Acidobacteriota bacterium]